MGRKIILPIVGAFITIEVIIMMYIADAITLLYEENQITEPFKRLIEEKIIYIGIIGSLMGVIVFICILIYLDYRMMQPVIELTKEVNNFKFVNHAHTLRQYDIEEIGQLAGAIDRMSEYHYRTERKLKHQKSKVESVLKHLQDGLLILDEEGFIKEYNTCAEDYLEIPKGLQRCHISYLIREVTCQNVLNEAIEKNHKASCELVRNQCIFHIRIGTISKEGKNYGYVLTITDITKTRQLEAMRYEFVTNVTHELKTPLTSIQGFVETLQDGALENKEVATRFLNIIDIEAKRLYQLIQDILLLSEIETMTGAYTETVNLTDVIEEVSILLKNQADSKEIKIVLDLQEDITLEKVNYEHIKQILMNLISNAIKYTDEGEICIATKQEKKENILTITDTGIGIPKEHIAHIFERFYRVDKSRSRKSGGTGLGLSIVKHMISYYGFKISVESEIQKGSQFKITF